MYRCKCYDLTFSFHFIFRLLLTCFYTVKMLTVEVFCHIHVVQLRVYSCKFSQSAVSPYKNRSKVTWIWNQKRKLGRDICNDTCRYIYCVFCLFFREIWDPSEALSLCEHGHFCERTSPVAVWEVTRGLEPTSTHH